jgi:hypothetical protein
MMDQNAVAVPAVDQARMERLGIRMGEQFDQYKKDRRETEQQWLRNLRQVKGVYDPEIANVIPDDQSTAYPKITRTKVIGTVARLMEMLFPQTEKNWGIAPSPLPNLSESDLQIVLDGLAAPGEDGQPAPEPTTQQIEEAVFKYAKLKSERMSKEIDDQLVELDYITLARRIIFSGVQYSIGILKGPMVKHREGRTWVKDPLTRRLTAKTVKKLMPFYEAVSVWDWYPDMSAKDFEQMDGSYQRHIMSRNQFAELAKRPDFKADTIKKWLRDNTAGNYKELDWETELRIKADRKNLTDLAGRKYEVWEWWGFVSGHDLKACGVPVPDDQLDMELEANLWGIGKILIKHKLNPFDEKIRPFHVFVYEEDDINLTGNGLPQTVRDSQMAIGEAARMLLDNASVVCGDMVEINIDLLSPGQSLDIHARKAWLREGTGSEAGLPAVRPLQLNSHINELTGIINLFMGFADMETALPPPAMGDPTKGGSEALRTTGGMSMLMGAAALPIRDTVRNFDKFTVSFIGSLYYWNMEFNDNEDIKGDYQVVARGSTSLIAKEVRATSLDQFSMTLTEDERMHVSTRKLLEERMKSRDIPLDVLDDVKTVEARQTQKAQIQQQLADEQSRKLDAEAKKLVSAAFKDVAQAVAAQTGANVETFNAIVEGVTSANKAQLETGAAEREASGVPITARAGAAGAAPAGRGGA